MISIIIPTYNEAGNIRRLLDEIRKQINSKDFEIIIVDDNSPDMTWKIVDKYIEEHSLTNIRILVRKKERGLASAVIYGFKKSKGEIIGVIDADLSHPPKLLGKLIDGCKKNDIVIASRYVDSGRKKMSVFRKMVSESATMLARPLTKIHDPMSGYFFFKRDVIESKKLNPRARRRCHPMNGNAPSDAFAMIRMSNGTCQ